MVQTATTTQMTKAEKTLPLVKNLINSSTLTSGEKNTILSALEDAWLVWAENEGLRNLLRTARTEQRRLISQRDKLSLDLTIATSRLASKEPMTRVQT